MWDLQAVTCRKAVGEQLCQHTGPGSSVGRVRFRDWEVTGSIPGRDIVVKNWYYLLLAWHSDLRVELGLIKS